MLVGVALASGESFPVMGKQRGGAILISDDFKGIVSQWRKDPDGRVLSILGQFNSFASNLVCIYAPATFWLAGKFYLRPYMSAIIFTGDFNFYEYKFNKLSGCPYLN